MRNKGEKDGPGPVTVSFADRAESIADSATPSVLLYIFWEPEMCTEGTADHYWPWAFFFPVDRKRTTGTRGTQGRISIRAQGAGTL